MALLDDVSFDIYLGQGDIGANAGFPPDRFRLRDARLAALYKLWKGDFSDYKIAHEVKINYFHSYSTKLANLLLMTSPEAGDVLLAQAAYDALVDMTRYGGALIGWDGETMRSYDPMSWYPQRDADVFVRPFTSDEAPDANHDSVNVLVVPKEGKASSDTYGWQHGQIGAFVKSEEIGEIEIALVPRPPTVGIWGTAKYTELCDPVIEIARRFSRNRRLLDLYSGPVPVFTESTPDAETRYGVAAGASEDERRQTILEGQIGLLEEETIFLPGELVGVNFLQPDVSGIGASLSQVAEMKEAIQTLTGLPSLTGTSVPSGEALKRVFLHFYAESAAMQTDVTDAFSQLLGVDVIWEHVFDQMEFSDEGANQPAQEAVDEPTE